MNEVEEIQERKEKSWMEGERSVKARKGKERQNCLLTLSLDLLAVRLVSFGVRSFWFGGGGGRCRC